MNRIIGRLAGALIFGAALSVAALAPTPAAAQDEVSQEQLWRYRRVMQLAGGDEAVRNLIQAAGHRLRDTILERTGDDIWDDAHQPRFSRLYRDAFEPVEAKIAHEVASFQARDISMADMDALVAAYEDAYLRISYHDVFAYRPEDERLVDGLIDQAGPDLARAIRDGATLPPPEPAPMAPRRGLTDLTLEEALEIMELEGAAQRIDDAVGMIHMNRVLDRFEREMGPIDALSSSQRDALSVNADVVADNLSAAIQRHYAKRMADDLGLGAGLGLIDIFNLPAQQSLIGARLREPALLAHYDETLVRPAEARVLEAYLAE